MFVSNARTIAKRLKLKVISMYFLQSTFLKIGSFFVSTNIKTRSNAIKLCPGAGKSSRFSFEKD